MKTLSSVQCGIKALEGVLNRMVDGVNARTPVAGAGILVTENNFGAVISLSKKDDDKGQTGSQGGGQGGGGPSLNVITQLIWKGVKWQDMNVMDPASCTQSTLTVLVKTGLDSDTISINVPNLAAFPSSP